MRKNMKLPPHEPSFRTAVRMSLQDVVRRISLLPSCKGRRRINHSKLKRSGTARKTRQGQRQASEPKNEPRRRGSQEMATRKG